MGLVIGLVGTRFRGVEVLGGRRAVAVRVAECGGIV